MSEAGKSVLVLVIAVLLPLGAGSSVVPFAGSAAGGRSAGQAGQADEGLALPRSEMMIMELTKAEQDKLKVIMAGKPAEEARAYIVTRWFARLTKGAKAGDVKLDDVDRDNIKKHLDIDYCVDLNEQLLLMNELLYFGIDPDKGVESKGLK